MALGDLFSDSNEQAAFEAQRKARERAKRVGRKALGGGATRLRESFAGARDDITGGAATARGDIVEGRTGSLRDIRRGATTARGDITGARDASLAEYDPYLEATRGAAGFYSDALGLGGAEGTERATGRFRATPGYEFQVNQGLDAIDRRAASRGMLGSGNTSIDTINYAGGLADQEFDDYLANLDAQQRLGVDIAGSRANIRTGAGRDLSTIATGEGRDLADIRTGAGRDLSTIATGEGRDLAQIGTRLGDREYSYGQDLAELGERSELGIGDALSEFQKGKDATGANIFGAVTGGLSLGANLLGFPGVGGGFKPKPYVSKYGAELY